MKPSISVIVPVLNREKEIAECIHSVIDQSCTDWELLIIDNGSTDSTVKICHDLTAADNRIRLLEAPRGVSKARNAGIEAANGKYLFFLDSDDVIHPSLLETLLVSMQAHQADLAGTKRVEIPQSHWDDFSRKPRTHKGIGRTIFLSNAEATQLVFRCTTPLNIIGGVMILRSLVGDTRFREDLHIGEDFYFMYENLIKGPNVLFVDSVWYFARLHENNLSWDYSFQGFYSRFYRRKLVWLQEASLGRMEHVRLQKSDALDVYTRCLRQHHSPDPDTAKMQLTMKDHKKELLPDLNAKQKLLYLLSVNCPGLYLRLFKG
jgi:glycosyltransferase involved in cell wall biosynthesis